MPELIPGDPRPDYQGGSIVNLMASLIRARGGVAEYPDLGLLPAGELAKARHLVLLVIDGLGDDWLQRQAPDGLLARHRIGALTSVFPSTTASAITSYLTGDAPQQHGLTGWFTWLRELGCVMTVLPGHPRYGGVGYRAAGVDVARLLGTRPVFGRIATPSVCVAPARIARSDFNRAHLGPARSRPYHGLGGLMRQLRRALRNARTPGYTYAYWPKLDAIGHRYGIGSPAARAHLQQIETRLAALIAAIAGTDTLLLVCADHGQIDSSPDQLTDLADHPELADCLRIPLCGEPRAAFCYVRPDRVARFERYCTGVLGDTFALHASADLLAAGLFGLGTPHPRLAERIGDYVLLPRGRRVIRDALPFDRPFQQIGVHGGLSPAELRVPLCLFRG